MKKLICILLAGAMALSMAACGGNPQPAASSDPSSAPAGGSSEASPSSAEEDPILTGEKPELKILCMYLTYNMEEQPSAKIVEEITGYKVHYYNLPAENAEQKLLLEISTGEDYDLLLRMNTTAFAQLSTQGALIDLNPLLQKYGGDVTDVVSDVAWKTVTDENGAIYGMPHENGVASAEEPYGMLQGGIGIRSDVLEELGLELPKTLDEFTGLLRAAKAKYGGFPMTGGKASIFIQPLLSAFGIGDATWYDIDGTYTPRIKHPAMVEYLSYMQSLYKEGLFDNDFIINTAESAQEKYANKTSAALAPLMFWSIPSILNALHTNNPEAENKIMTGLAKDANTKPVHTIAKGANYISCITKNSKNPEHAMNWFNIISNRENSQKIYLGEEGVSFEIKDGNYYPIFTDDENDLDFTAYTNADQFTGVWDTDYVFKMWQARARKTPEMAVAFEEMNSRASEYSVYETIENYGMTNEVVQKYSPALNTMTNEKLQTAIVEGTDPAKVIADIIAEWDANGGLEMEAAMQAFYDEYKDLV